MFFKNVFIHLIPLGLVFFAESVCSDQIIKPELKSICSSGSEFKFCNDMSLALAQLPLTASPDSNAYWLLFRDCDCTLRENTIQIIKKAPKGKRAIIFSGKEAALIGISTQERNGFKNILFECAGPASTTNFCVDTLVCNGSYYVVSGEQKHSSPFNAILELDEAIFDSLTSLNNNQSPLASTWNAGIRLFKSGKKLEAAQTLLKAVGPKPWSIDNNNVGIFNDLGFFLEETGQFRDAVDVLADVIVKFPDRTPAYLNIADAYAGLKNNDKAKENYKKYMDLMTKAGKQGKVPKRVIDAIGK